MEEGLKVWIASVPVSTLCYENSFADIESCQNSVWCTYCYRHTRTFSGRNRQVIFHVSPWVSTISRHLCSQVADVIQIPAFLCRQTDLLVAAGKTGKVINIKKGQFCAASVWLIWTSEFPSLWALVSASSQVMRNSAEKVRSTGNPNVMVCERGTMFGYADLIVDPRNLVWMRDANCPVVSQSSLDLHFLFSPG